MMDMEGVDMKVVGMGCRVGGDAGRVELVEVDGACREVYGMVLVGKFL